MAVRGQVDADRWEKAMSYKAQMHGSGESSGGIVPAKQPNEGQGGPQEAVEGRPLTKENTEEPNSLRTPGRESEPSGLRRVRQAAKKDKELRFTALLHHVNLEQLRSSYHSLKKRAAAGVDGVTWQEYGEDLEERLRDLHGRIHRGALALNEDGMVSLSSDKVCRGSSLVVGAKPSRRVWIPKADGRQRPLGIAALEDKIVQHA